MIRLIRMRINTILREITRGIQGVHYLIRKWLRISLHEIASISQETYISKYCGMLRLCWSAGTVIRETNTV